MAVVGWNWGGQWPATGAGRVEAESSAGAAVWQDEAPAVEAEHERGAAHPRTATGAEAADEHRSGLQWRAVKTKSSKAGEAAPGDERADPRRRRRRVRRQAGSRVGSAGANAAHDEPTGTVHVTTQGGTAEVLVAGEHHGRTPTTFELPVGKHELELRSQQGGTRELNVDVQAGRRLVLSVSL
jgi:hypothetical protein